MFPLKDDIPTRRFPILTVAIIAICTLVYFGFEQGTWGLGQTGNERVVEYGAIPYEVTHPDQHCIADAQKIACGDIQDDQPPTWLTVITSMFMHGSLLHLLGNMLFLVAALAGQTLIGPNAAVPTVGASGAIAAVLGAYALLYPRARVVTVVFIVIFFTILELPALVVLGLWFLLQVLYGASEVTQPVGGGGVAYFAHIGGFVFGLLTIKLFADRAQEDYDRRHRLPAY